MLPVAVAMLPTTGPGADRSSTDSARSVERKHQSAPPKQMEKPHANAAPAAAGDPDRRVIAALLRPALFSPVCAHETAQAAWNTLRARSG